MQIRYLTLCLIALSLSACSQHVIKSNANTGQSLEQKAVTGLNAMFETSGYDYQGKLNFHANLAPNTTKNSKVTQQESAPSLDPVLQHQIEQYLKVQKLRLGHQEKQHLYTALAKEQLPNADRFAAKEGYGSNFDQFALNLLSNIQFSYNGSVHYRQKLASLNLEAKYEKPTLLVHAKVPMVVDFNEYKFYINYFSLMPYLVNKDSQASFAYIDFSKYKNEINRVDFKKLADYLKQVNALSYALAEPKGIQALPLNAKDKNLAVVEKIRLSTTLEQLQLQMALYEQVNRPYFLNSVVGIKPTDAVAEQAATTVATQDSTQKHKAVAPAGEVDDVPSLTKDEAAESSLQLSLLIDTHFSALGQGDTAEPATESGCLKQDKSCAATAVAADTVVVTEQPEDIVAADAVQTADKGSDEYLNQQQCQELISQPQRATMGALTFCQHEYDLNAFASKEQDVDQTKLIDALSSLSPIFEPYASDQLMDVKTFSGLWAKHQPEIQQALKANAQQIPLVMDVGLDAQGRAILVDYDVQITSQKYGTVNIQADFNIQNYGQASTIDGAQLRQAKSLAEISKGSVIENMVRGFSTATGGEETETDAATTVKNMLSLNEQLKQLAEKTYQQTHSYAQTYQALWGMQMAAQNRDLLKNYNAQSLHEIAQVYAYWFADEAIYNPTGQALKQIQALQKKHDLELDQQFNHELGEAVYQIVNAVVAKDAERQAWQQLVKQYKQPKAIFAQQYMQNFKQDYDVDQPQQLKAVADILAQAYVDSTQNRLSLKSIEKLTLEQDGYIDLELYQKTYTALKENLNPKK
ncbi:hypothetical protein [Acinetobacter kyonggiensis]|uniref:Lipoprotein n=1 Tax=Acinetobacter kyonggiensis TaxID=595670 RepID=A0A1H3J9H9_9GAMM|nr:hypothetical protein [Acinetobacter kyonggiensis]SDY36611.1 hypothetical protein SAMN05421643_108127 [Acinetobacter kyonggiensis]